MPLAIVLHGHQHDPGGAGAHGRIVLDAPRIVLGRSEGCDVRIPDRSVGARHVTLHARGASWVAVDEGSANGTRLGKTRLPSRAQHALGSGPCVLRLGRFFVELVPTQETASRQPAAIARGLATEIVARSLLEEGEDVRPRMILGDGSEVVLERGRPVVIGRSREADVVLADADASRRHAEVAWDGDGVVVRDLGSKLGTTIGDRLVGPAGCTWRPGETLAIGASVLELAFEAPEALAEIERAPDERVPLQELETVAPSSHAAEDSAPDDDEDFGGADAGDVSDQGGAPAAGEEAEGPGTTALAARDEARARVRRANAGWSLTDVAVVLLAVGVFSLSAVGYLVLLK